MRLAGYHSETFTKGFYGDLHIRGDWDILLEEKYGIIRLTNLSHYIAFIESLFKYDIFAIPFTGYFLGWTPLWRIEAYLLKLANKKTILLPFGGDCFVYRNVRSTSMVHALLMSYPKEAKNQGKINNKVTYWCQHGDVVIPGIVGPDGFGRWDVLMPSQLHIDLDEWGCSQRKSLADGYSQTVYITHAPNHRGFKGTEFIIESVKQLQTEGLKVELILIENKPNVEVKRILQEETDILAEQIIFTGHGLNGLEGMASGLPIICNLEDETYTLPLRRYSFLNECPIVSACPETLTDVLRKLVTQPELRQKIGKSGREYVEKYHGLDSAQFLFKEVIEYIYGRRESLINLFHPILGEYNKRKPVIEPPLIESH
jgi:glycosyltransferase involved in cell wall biosynthesis